MSKFKSKISDIFYDEALDILERMENNLLQIAEKGNDDSIFADIYRGLHTIKGNSAGIGLVAFPSLVHSLESLVQHMKDKSIKYDKKIADILLRACDVLKTGIDDLSQTGHEIINGDDLIQEVSHIFETNNLSFTDYMSSRSEDDIIFVDDDLGAQIMAAIDSESQSEKKPEDNKNSKENAESNILETSIKSSIKVRTDKLDTLINLVGELIVNQSVLAGHRKNQTLNHSSCIRTIDYMDKLISEVRDLTMSLRMVPMTPLVNRLKRSVHDLAIKLEKDVNFKSIGDDTEVDKTIFDKIGEPLIHIVRNAMDHGIEPKDERKKQGKDPIGKITVKLFQKDEFLVIEISDDGRGLNKEAIRKKGIAKGLLNPNIAYSDQELYQLIFNAGFSTRETVSEISGRGIGMDAVAKALYELGGSIKIKTELNRGSTFVISLPLSLSIITGMIVEVNEMKHIIPHSQLLETIDLKKIKIESSTDEGHMMNLRGEVIPILSLSKILYNKTSEKEFANGLTKHKGIITAYNGEKVSFSVESIIGQQEIVIKKLGKEMHNVPGISGGAILENGEPGIILNLHDFLRMGA